jgi:succinate dehydrogenase / fumarate reductase, iron-sulfur subunit
MSERTIEVRILRYKPGAIDPPRFQSFQVSVGAGTTVLAALEQIRRDLDPGLMYRHSCHHSACGTCACRVDGVERLACTTRLLALGTETVTLEPLRGFPVVGDLVVDVCGFYADIDPAWDTLRPVEPPAGAAHGEGGLQRFEECIECGACVSACPVDRAQPGFMGPAALAALNAQRVKHPADEPALLALAGTERGEKRCERALRCSRVCPTGVFPARHIAELRSRLRGRTF